jgi:hypothetical protein
MEYVNVRNIAENHQLHDGKFHKSGTCYCLENLCKIYKIYVEKVWFNRLFKQSEYEGWLKIKYKHSSCDDNSYQLQLNSFSKLYVFNTTYFS